MMCRVLLSLSWLALTLAPLSLAAAEPRQTPQYASDPSKSTLSFTFTQAGAQNTGRFKTLSVTLDFAPDNLAASRMEVRVEARSLDTGDEERDQTLRSADLLAVDKFPESRFVATRFSATPTGFDALGALTLRGTTREIHVPFSFRTADEQGKRVARLVGRTVIRRLDYGVGQGDWKATDQVGNEVAIAYDVRLVPR